MISAHLYLCVFHILLVLIGAVLLVCGSSSIHASVCMPTPLGPLSECVCICECAQDGWGHDPTVCPLAEWRRQSPTRWPTFIEGLLGQPSRPWPQMRWQGWRGGKQVRGRIEGGWMDMNSAHTHTHTSDQTAQSKCNIQHPLPGQQLARWWREIDQLGGFPPKMKIDGRISTAVGQPLASFSLLKTAHFHSGGKKEVQGLVVLVVTVIERVRNNKASKRLPFAGLSGSV